MTLHCIELYSGLGPSTSDPATHITGRSPFGSIRCGCGLLENLSVWFGSVRFGKLPFPVRRDSACVFWARRGSVRFSSIRFGSTSGSGWF